MDRIADFIDKHVSAATEVSLDTAMLLGLGGILAAEIIGIGACFKYASKKNAKLKASTQNAYFEKHEIPEADRKTYEARVVASAKADAKKLITNLVQNPKSKPALDKIRESITNEIREYIDDGEKPVFDASKLTIKFGFIMHNTTDIEMIDVRYNGPGFIPADNVWELSSIATRDIMAKIEDGLRKKYAEEIQCKFVGIDLDTDYGVISIE